MVQQIVKLFFAITNNNRKKHVTSIKLVGKPKSYAPDLNPVESIWNHTKCVDLANFIPNDLDELQTAILKSIDAERSDPILKRSFFEHAGLKI